MPDDFDSQMMKAQMHMNQIKHLADTNQIQWTQIPAEQLPRPTSMQSFQGVAKGYVLTVLCANIVEAGRNIYEGMLVAEGGTIIHLSHQDQFKTAEHLFNNALKSVGQA